MEQFRLRVWLMVGCLTLLTVSLLAMSGISPGWARQTDMAEVSGWTTVFSDTFATISPVWTITDTTAGQYQWGVTPYTVEIGTVLLEEHGLWAAGGGAIGRTQTWPTGTYTNSMTTWAIAGPFTLTQKVWDMQLQSTVYNDVALGDEFFIGLSDDGVHFRGITATVSTLALQTMSWSTQAYSTSEAVWIALLFTSDADGVAAGPLVDNLALAFNYGTYAYLPLVRRDPTPTPTFTPTPLPFYFDGFDDPASGWYVGPAWRYNDWCRDTECYTRWEVVASMSYDNSNYQISVPLTWHGGGDVDTWFVLPALAAPLPEIFYPLPQRYCIEARGKFANSQGETDPWWARWGIVFAANESMTDFYTFIINANHDYAVTQYRNYIFPGNRQPDGEYVNVEIHIVPWDIRNLTHLMSTQAYNTLKVVVDGKIVDIYINNHHLERVELDSVLRGRIGIVGGPWEVTPVELEFDYFSYKPNCP